MPSDVMTDTSQETGNPESGQNSTSGHASDHARAKPVRPKKIWIDLDNSPHVPFFLPIISELRKRGYEVLLSARDSYQVVELLKLYDLQCRVVGKHYGKNRLFKLAGTVLRSVQLLPWVIKGKPDFAISHGSRAQVIATSVLGIPTAVAFDYEFTSKISLFQTNWVFVPDMIPDSSLAYEKSHVLKYPGLKEDVYVPKLSPDPTVLRSLGIEQHEIVVTVRPPAVEAHYHNPESEVLFTAALNFLISQPDLRIVLLPRNDRQVGPLRRDWAKPIADGKIIIPTHVVDGLNLIWFSDLVISGGGTMNREAAALGVPVYSIFRGKIGAVDRYLSDHGRLVLIEGVEDIKTKIILARREKPVDAVARNNAALESILGGIISIVENKCLPIQP